MSKNGFSESTQTILAAANIGAFDHFSAIEASYLVDNDVSFAIVDLDGVLRPYNKALDASAIDQLCGINEKLPLGAVAITNNPAAKSLILPDDIPLYPLRAMQPWNAKPLPFQIKKVVDYHGATAERTVAFGDGLMTDVLAYHLAGIKHIGMIASLGAHWTQELVHKAVYRPLSPMAAAVIRLSKAK